MKKPRSTQLKAAFLLVIFALNMIVGFACSLGLDMGFNSQHHNTKAGTSSVHIHKDGKKHIHNSSSGHSQKHGHSHKKDATASKKDDCCKDKVVKLQSADKSFQYSKTTVDVNTYIIPNNNTRIVAFNTADPRLRIYMARHFHPPPCDIRIAIQSFQI